MRLTLPFALLVCVLASPGYAQSCLVEGNSVYGVRPGFLVTEAVRILEPQFLVSEKKPTGPYQAHTVSVSEKASKRTLLVLTASSQGKVVFIDITGPCTTKEGVAIGSTLGEAIKVYGKPNLDVSSAGYYVIFDSMPELSFQIDQAALPAELRAIPDDVVTRKTMNRILSHRKAKVISMQISPKS